MMTNNSFFWGWKMKDCAAISETGEFPIHIYISLLISLRYRLNSCVSWPHGMHKCRNLWLYLALSIFFFLYQPLLFFACTSSHSSVQKAEEISSDIQKNLIALFVLFLYTIEIFEVGGKKISLYDTLSAWEVFDIYCCLVY